MHTPSHCGPQNIGHFVQLYLSPPFFAERTDIGPDFAVSHTGVTPG